MTPVDRDPASRRVPVVPPRRAFALLLVAVLAAVVAAGVLAVVRPDGAPWTSLAIWIALSAGANMLQVPAAGNVHLSMGSAINVAVAALFSPATACAVVFVGSTNEWELKGETSLPHALFNRGQLAVATLFAALVLQAPGRLTWWSAILAVASYQASNWLLVALAERTARGEPIARTVNELLPARAFAVATYVLVGLTGVALALVYEQVGAWAVVLMLLPLVGARYAVSVANELERAERGLRHVSEQLTHERERERRRIASDIHDNALQQLAAVQMHADGVTAALDRGDTARARSTAAAIRDAAEDAVTDLRTAIHNLRLANLSDGLAPAIERYARSFATHAGTQVSVDVRIDDRDPPLALGLLLLECVQVALSNVSEHAGADRVTVDVADADGWITLRVRDDGQGVTAAKDPGAHRGLGLALTREKLGRVGGGLDLAAAPGGGTEVTFRVPRPAS